MSSPQTGNEIDTLETNIEEAFVDGELLSFTPAYLEMDSTDIRNVENDFNLVSSDILHGSPRERKETSDILNYQGKKMPVKRENKIKSSFAYQPISRPLSSIPLPVKSPKSATPNKIPSTTLSRNISRQSRPSSGSINKPNQITNKHTLEIQFLNKKKRLSLLKKDLIEKQKPVLDLYQNLLQIKKRLEELGKVVLLEEIKLMPYTEQADKPPESTDGAGESISPEVVIGMQTSIEEIPKTLMEICKNLLSRRAMIVELLESVTKSEVDVSDLSDKIETLKMEGVQLQNNLDVIINDHEKKIRELVINWQTLLNDKKNINTNTKIEDLEDKLKDQEKLTLESNQVILELQRKLDDKRSSHDKSIIELNNVIHALKEQILKLEQELEIERKSAVDFKNRNNTNAQNSKMLRSKISELENDKKTAEAANADLTKKVKFFQEQIKHKEALWNKEKEEMNKNLKHQENLLQKLTADKNKFETRLGEVEDQRNTTQEELQKYIDVLNVELDEARTTVAVLTKEKEDATEKCREMEEYITKKGVEFRDNMNLVSSSIEWGKEIPSTVQEAQNYSQSLMKDIVIREYQDKIRQLEKENNVHKEAIALAEINKNSIPTETEKAVQGHYDAVINYKRLLAVSEQRLDEKSQEVSRLTAEIKLLKVRQEHLEEQNQKCPAENLQRMVEEGRQKLNELMKKSMESEQKILYYEDVLEKQKKQMNDLENLLRYRENMAGILKASRDELFLEKESLTKYSHEMRTVLTEVTKEGKMKDRLIKELQEKIDLRERQISKLEKEAKILHDQVQATNEKRFRLQETIGSMEKELQSTKAHVNQLADINTRYDIGMQCSNSLHYNIDKTVFSNVERLSDKSSTVDNVHTEHFYTKSHFTEAAVDLSLNNTNINYQHELNSRSLINLSLQKVDFLKARLNYLTMVNLTPIKSVESLGTLRKPRKSCSTQTLKKNKNPQRHFKKILELTTNRYEFLQKQAYESYDELTSLVKLAISAQKLCEK